MNSNDFIDPMTCIFKQAFWEEEARQAANIVNKFFCWDRRKKMNRLIKLIRIGSAYYNYGRVEDKDRLGQTLNEIEDIALRYLK